IALAEAPSRPNSYRPTLRASIRRRTQIITTFEAHTLAPAANRCPAMDHKPQRRKNAARKHERPQRAGDDVLRSDRRPPGKSQQLRASWESSADCPNRHRFIPRSLPARPGRPAETLNDNGISRIVIQLKIDTAARGIHRV